jgi:hypothetical protein
MSLDVVCRYDVALAAADPDFGLPTYRKEMINRTSQVGQYFQDNNAHV